MKNSYFSLLNFIKCNNLMSILPTTKLYTLPMLEFFFKKNEDTFLQLHFLQYIFRHFQKNDG